jgi:rhodanese-related sulfurtransferase
MSRYIVDVREPDEFVAEHVDGAINLPLSDLLKESTNLDDIPKDAEVIVYCNSGRRSDISKSILESNGYTNVTNSINKAAIDTNATD